MADNNPAPSEPQVDNVEVVPCAPVEKIRAVYGFSILHHFSKKKRISLTDFNYYFCPKRLRQNESKATTTDVSCLGGNLLVQKGEPANGYILRAPSRQDFDPRTNSYFSLQTKNQQFQPNNPDMTEELYGHPQLSNAGSIRSQRLINCRMSRNLSLEQNSQNGGVPQGKGSNEFVANGDQPVLSLEGLEQSNRASKRIVKKSKERFLFSILEDILLMCFEKKTFAESFRIYSRLVGDVRQELTVTDRARKLKYRVKETFPLYAKIVYKARDDIMALENFKLTQFGKGKKYYSVRPSHPKFSIDFKLLFEKYPPLGDKIRELSEEGRRLLTQSQTLGERFKNSLKIEICNEFRAKFHSECSDDENPEGPVERSAHHSGEENDEEE